MNLKNARILLTGACGGLGSALAMQLAAAGASLLLTGRDPLRLAELRDSLESQDGGGVDGRTSTSTSPRMHSTVLADLTRPEGIAAAAGAAREFSVNVLINSAGVGGFGLYEKQPWNEINTVLDTNLLAPMRLTNALLPWLKAQPQAALVNIGSAFGSIPFAGFAAYSSAKAGLRAFSQALRRELADTQVAVIYIAPRAIDTALNSRAVVALNTALGNRVDSTASVAASIVEALREGRHECHLGFPERLFAWLNALSPALIDRGVRNKLRVIRQHATEGYGKEAQERNECNECKEFVPATPSSQSHLTS